MKFLLKFHSLFEFVPSLLFHHSFLVKFKSKYLYSLIIIKEVIDTSLIIENIILKSSQHFENDVSLIILVFFHSYLSHGHVWNRYVIC